MRTTFIFLLLALAVALSAASEASSHIGITRDTVDNGGGAESAGGPYLLSATVGQWEAGTSAGGDYLLSGGFWSPAAQLPVAITLHDGSTAAPATLLAARFAIVLGVALLLLQLGRAYALRSR